MKVLEYFGHEAFLEYSSFITEINELGLSAIMPLSRPNPASDAGFFGENFETNHLL